MVKQIWVGIDQWNVDMVNAAIEGGADALVLPEGYSRTVLEFGKITTVAKDGDLVLGNDVVFYELKSVEDEDEIVLISKRKIVIIVCENWKVIPLENIIAKGGKNVIVQVNNLDDAELVLSILESGVKGVLIKVDSLNKLRPILLNLINFDEGVNLKTALVESISHLGMGDRVCIDTCTMMLQGQGMLVGNTSAFLFLIHAENIKNSYIEQRPFRVNAGAVHAYIRMTDGKTKYLSELCAGDIIQLIDFNGTTEKAIIGRVKIEKRPLLLLKASCENKIGTMIVQNAETIRFVSPEGIAKSVCELNFGDEIVVKMETQGRHFGYKIKEYINEQ